MNLRSRAIAPPTSLALDDVAGPLGVLDEVVHEQVDPLAAGLAEDRDLLARQVALAQHAGAQRVVDVVVDVGDRGPPAARSRPSSVAGQVRARCGAGCRRAPAR